MPLYQFVCKKCGCKALVVRSVDTRNDPITEKDEVKCMCEPGAEEWERIECASVQMVRGAKWGKGKGYWAK